MKFLLEHSKEIIPIIGGLILIIVLACAYIKSKFISLLGLDETFVKRSECSKCNKEIYQYIDIGRKEILDKLDQQNSMLNEMKTSHKIFMNFIENKLGN